MSKGATSPFDLTPTINQLQFHSFFIQGSQL
jgi:hypothetical protein